MERAKSSSDRSPLLHGDSLQEDARSRVHDNIHQERKESSEEEKEARKPAAPPHPSQAPAAQAPPSRYTSGNAAYDERFECNICLDGVNDPVVTRCGHLFCWPCLYRWLNSNHSDCPVCKAGVTIENIIPLYGRGTEEVDPRTKPQPQGNIPSRPAAERPDVQPPPNQGAQSPFGPNQANISFSAGFGFFPSLFGLQFQSFNTTPNNQNNANMTQEEQQQAMLSRLLLMLGSFIILCLLLF
mmetsp:Transcript_31688/g.40640  ORF Transcript_31688/g.40640 Transcript_31688/m.40640 type:complete len:241 (-) Transcript_31688:325-1047(-)